MTSEDELRARLTAEAEAASFWKRRYQTVREAALASELARLDGAARIAELEQQMQGLRARCEGLARDFADRGRECGRLGDADGAILHAGASNLVRALVRGEGEAS